MAIFKYYPLNKKNNSGLAKSALAISVFLLIVGLLYISSDKVKNIFNGISAPIEKKFWSAGISSSGFLSSFFRGNILLQENEALRVENQKLMAKVIALQSIANANEAQEMISLYDQDQHALLLTEVIGMDGQDILSINKGSDQGVLVGMPVVNKQSVIVGKISAVYKNFSTVSLLSHASSITNVTIQHTDDEDQIIEIEAVLKGEGNFKAFLDLIPVDGQVSQGDAVITSSLEKFIPKNLLVGMVTTVDKDDQKPFQQAKIDLFFTINSADVLFVITNYKQK